MSPAIEQLDAEIARLQVEIGNVERMPLTVKERIAATEAELRDCEQFYRAHGLKVSSGHPGEAAHLQRQALIGACMVIGGDRLLQIEAARIQSEGEGMSAPDKARRLAELRRQIERQCARRELLLRQQEAPGEFRPRAPHPEFVIATVKELEQIAR